VLLSLRSYFVAPEMEIMAKLVAALDKVKTSLTLGGLVVIVLYGLYSQVFKLNIFGQLSAG
jgi:hypothetical protein